MKICGNCNFLNQVYRRFLLSFGKFKEHYYCSKCNQMTSKECSCENWQPKVRAFDFSKQRFDEVEEDIMFLSDHLKSTE